MPDSNTSASSRITANHAGQEFDHPTSQLTATTFVPATCPVRVAGGQDYYQVKERCVFCDILSQELQQNLRMIEVRGDFVGACPYAPRVPYETWIFREIMRRPSSARLSVARMRSILPALFAARCTGFAPSPTNSTWCCTPRRIRCISPRRLGYWKTIEDDYHWHIEILPIVGGKAKSYTFKEVYYSPVTSETGVKRLRDAKIAG